MAFCSCHRVWDFPIPGSPNKPRQGTGRNALREHRSGFENSLYSVSGSERKPPSFKLMVPPRGHQNLFQE